MKYEMTCSLYLLTEDQELLNFFKGYTHQKGEE